VTKDRLASVSTIVTMFLTIAAMIPVLWELFPKYPFYTVLAVASPLVPILAFAAWDKYSLRRYEKEVGINDFSINDVADKELRNLLLRAIADQPQLRLELAKGHSRDGSQG
jgi:hypothetical protein